MSRFARALSAALALTLVLSAPGAVSYHAAAQTVNAPRGLPSIGAIGFLPAPAGNGTASSDDAAPAALSLGSSLLASAALTPALQAPSAAALAVQSPVAAAAALTTRVGATPRPESALVRLQDASTALASSLQAPASDAPRVALDSIFEGAAARPNALVDAPFFSAASDSPPLDSFAPHDSADGIRSIDAPALAAARPATSIKRTLAVGYLAALIPAVVSLGSMFISQFLGYQLHPNYQGIGGNMMPNLLQALGLIFGATVMAPISEEIIFRAGLQGGLAKLTAKLHLGSFVLPALITSAVFVAVHETSDPLLISTRMAHAMILSYVYRKEGVVTAMFAHGFFNGLLILTGVLTALGLPWLALAGLPLLHLGMLSLKVINRQRPAVASGMLTPLPLYGRLSIFFAGLLMLGYFSIMPNILWHIGALALFFGGFAKVILGEQDVRLRH